jgi:hypothetical protein
MSATRAGMFCSAFSLIIASPANACNPLMSTANPRPTTANTLTSFPELIVALAPSPPPVVTLNVCNIGTVGARLSASGTGTPSVALARDECKVVTASTLFLRTASNTLLPAAQIAYCVVGSALRP